MATPAPRARAPKAAPAAGPSPAGGARAGAARRVTGKPAVRLPAVPARAKGGEKAPAPEPPAAAAARTDPRLQAALDKVRRNAKKAQEHRPASEKKDEAHAAVEEREKERSRLSLAQEAKVEEIKAAEGKPPEEKSFLELLEDEIEKVMPKTIEDTDSFMNKEDQEKFKGAMTGNVERQKQATTGDIKSAAQAPPDTTEIPKEAHAALPAEALPPAATQPVGARDAMPPPRPAEEVSLQPSKDEVERRMADDKVTDAQLAKANDPRFTAVLEAKAEVGRHADSAPQRYREAEQQTLAAAAARAAGAEHRGMAAMKETRGREGAAAKSRQELAKERDEARRKEVAGEVEKIFGETKKAVEEKLSTLEGEVTKMFDEGLKTAIDDMKRETNQKKNAWKKERYWTGPVFRLDLWTYDKVRGIERHKRVKEIYVEAAKEFTRDMKALMGQIAAHVERRLKEARDEVERGRKRIHHYVECLPEDLRKVGLAAEKEISERFDELKQSVDDKKRDLAQSLAQRYKDAHDKAGEAIKEMQAEDKGLVKAFLDKLGEIVDILRNFRRRVMSMLRRAASAIDLIVADPIGFLGNLLAAIKRGVGQFVDRIWEHLKTGFMAWLFGSLAAMGVAIPKDFSMPSILGLVLDVLGVTVAKIRGKVAKIVGERNVAMLEAAWEAVNLVLKGGPAALWEHIREHFSNLREMVVDAMQEWLIGAVIRSAATKIAMMFNPAGAIIQAILMIYRTVMFFIENIDRILAFVEAIIESVYNIATGAIGAAADWIEKALARTIPIIIGFLARLLGLSGLADRIKGFILRTQTRIENAIDKVIVKIVGGIRKIIGAGKAVVGKIVAWWKLRKRFTTPEGETHTIFVGGESAAGPLMIASKEQEYRAYINNVKFPATDKAKAKAKALALAKLGEIERLRKRNQDDGTKSQRFGELLDELSAATLTLMSGGPMPESTPPVYGGASAGGFGTTVTMNVLSAKGPGGSPADSDGMSGPVWDILKLRHEKATSKRRFYKLGHLLSMHLHGPGDHWPNLTPQSESGNQLFERGEGERQIKRWVVDEKKAVRYSVTAVYGRSTNKSAIIAKWKAAKVPDIPKKTAILNAEDKVPTAMRYDYQVIFEKGKYVQNGQRVANSAPNDIRQEAEKYHL